MSDVDKNRAAAAEIEELAIEAKEIVSLLRSGVPSDYGYALVYELRKRLSQTVAELGAGVPSRRNTRLAIDALDAQIG